MIVYIAGPYTNGDVGANVSRAIDVAESVAAMGHVPIVPHLSHFWHLKYQHDADFWLGIDLHLLQFCHAMIRLPGYSEGADKEEQAARRMGIRVFTSWKEFVLLTKENASVDTPE